jgi:GntR family transcriptional regulator
MKLEFDSNKPIYVQISENIENDILNKVVDEEEQVPSTNQLAALYRINPATAAKGINILVTEGILYKKRGVGMFVSPGAVIKIQMKRRKAFSSDYIVPLLEEASRLGISEDEIISMIKDEREK